jgi:2',3'-cyclic-nucleotide 2'-phosphodiesterase (5'-nucleotidase family)
MISSTVRRSSSRRLAPLLALTLGLTATIAACQGCRDPLTPGSGEPGVAGDKPTLRLYASSAIAGAIEPCGCTKDQLGGVDHLAAFMEAERSAAPNAFMIAAGPLYFLDPALRDDDRQQTLWKAETMAEAAKRMRLLAWAPGLNDWAGGGDTLAKLTGLSGAALLAGNLKGAPGATPTLVRDFAGIKFGFFGLAEPKDKLGRTPEGVTALPPGEAAKAAIDDLTKQGARVLVGVLSIPRGEALRLADNFPDIAVLVLGKPAEAGDTNDAPKPPVLLGNTLVVETSNHLQTVGVIDLHVAPGGKKDGFITFQDAGGVSRSEELLAVSSRIRDLEQKINGWEGDKHVKAEDLAARKADLEKLRAEKARLEKTETPVTGSFFRYRLVEVREKLGAEPQVKDALSAFYKRVNEHNKVAFADRKPKPVEDGQAGYIGVDACTDCHDEERKVWDSTPHSRAYDTLVKDSKEFNLDCVSCHVTGYGKRGGSTVTHNQKLQDVQCEICHGPGSLHAKAPDKKGLIVTKPSPDTCVSECHHPPHVEGFDPVAKMKLILGKGHGM